MQIVREQCWLNEILTSCQWVPEGLNLNPAPAPDAPEDTMATDEDLQAVLKGALLILRSPFVCLFAYRAYRPARRDGEATQHPRQRAHPRSRRVVRGHGCRHGHVLARAWPRAHHDDRARAPAHIGARRDRGDVRPEQRARCRGGHYRGGRRGLEHGGA